jgi:hypothetical protein
MAGWLVGSNTRVLDVLVIHPYFCLSDKCERIHFRGGATIVWIP